MTLTLTNRDGRGSSDRSSSSESSPAVATERLLDLVRGIEQPFTIDTLVRAVERDGVPVAHALQWLRDVEGDLVVDTGTRRHSTTALRGGRLFTAR